ncbi:MAG: hypothetical protein OXU61_01475 [Gammaproteobacteria bacterium]|nr:hypothetical protein [Gammaproteobacteria bacterium]
MAVVIMDACSPTVTDLWSTSTRIVVLPDASWTSTKSRLPPRNTIVRPAGYGNGDNHARPAEPDSHAICLLASSVIPDGSGGKGYPRVDRDPLRRPARLAACTTRPA